MFDMVNFKWDQKRALEVAKEDTVFLSARHAEKHVERHVVNAMT